MEIFIPELEIQALEQFPNAHTMYWYRVRPVSILSQEGEKHSACCARVKWVWYCLCTFHRAQGEGVTEAGQAKLVQHCYFVFTTG